MDKRWNLTEKSSKTEKRMEIIKTAAGGLALALLGYALVVMALCCGQ